MKKIKFLSATITIFLSINSASTSNGSAGKADIIIFSYDRSMQLQALYESIVDQSHGISGINTIYVIYRTSSNDFERAYQIFFKNCMSIPVIAKKQGSNPRHDFKPLVMQALQESECDYILLAVDDNIVKDHVDITQCIKQLEKTQAYAFYLRMGQNITKSYTLGTNNPVPKTTKIKDVNGDIMLWKFSDGTGEWAYPNSLDMSLYRKKYLQEVFAKLSFTSPNTLEGQWAHWGPRFYKDLNKSGLCFTQSKTLNVPLNLIQNDWPNAKNMRYSTHDLLKLFNDGFKIDITQYYAINNNAPHCEITPRFIKKIRPAN